MMKTTIKLSEIVREDRRTVSPKSKESSLVPFLGLEQIESQTGRILSYNSTSTVGTSNTFAFDTSHVLYGKLRPYLNKVAVPDKPGRCSTEIIPLLPCGVSRDFLALLLRTPRVVSAAMREKTGSRMPRANMSVVLATEFSIPTSVEAQEEIAIRFGAQSRAMLDARLAAQVQLRESDTLSRKFKENCHAKLRGVARIPLDDLLLRIDAGKSFQTTDRLAGEKELGVLKVSAVSWTEFDPKQSKAIKGDYVPDERHRVRAGDVIISRANTVELVGAVVRADRDYPNRLLSDKTLRLVLDERRCDPNYIVQFLRLPEARAHLERNATGTSDSMRNITQDTIRATAIALPDIKVQRLIARRLEGVDRAINSLREATKFQLRELTLLHAYLLDEVCES